MHTSNFDLTIHAAKQLYSSIFREFPTISCAVHSNAICRVDRKTLGSELLLTDVTRCIFESAHAVG